MCKLRFHMYLCLLLLSMTLFVCHFVPPYGVTEGIVGVSNFASSFVYLSVSVSLTIILIEKSGYDSASRH